MDISNAGPGFGPNLVADAQGYTIDARGVEDLYYDLSTYRNQTDSAIDDLDGFASRFDNQQHGVHQGIKNEFQQVKDRMREVDLFLDTGTRYLSSLSSYGEARQELFNVQASLNSINERVDALAASATQAAPQEVLDTLISQANIVNQSISDLEGFLATNPDFDISRGRALEPQTVRESIDGLKSWHSSLLDTYRSLSSAEFEGLSDLDQNRELSNAGDSIEWSQKAVMTGFGRAQAAAEAHGNRSEMLAQGAVLLRNITISGAQAIGGKLGGPEGGAQAGLFQAHITRMASDLGVELVSLSQGLSSAEKQALRAETQAALGPEVIDYLNAGGGPLIDGIPNMNRTGDFIAAFTTTLGSELANGTPTGEAVRTALNTALQAAAIGQGAGAGVDVLTP